jgi:retinol-binding protein 3
LWTRPNLPGKKFTGKPVFVLTSGSTFSAAEEFAYDLKSLKRATVVGETTGGGAHGTAPHRIDDHFFIRIPFARVVNPITKTDWEGTGVEPNVKVSAAQALAAAEKLAAGEFGKDRLH